MELTSAEQKRWLRVIGNRAAPFPDLTLRDIDVGAWGGCVVDAPARRALYVVVDSDDVVVYIGKVDRVEGSVADRLRQHHASNDRWDRVWVVTLNDCPSSQQVFDLELSLIQHFDPPDNKNGRPIPGAGW